MTANLLTFYSSKTEFLLIGLQQQLTKIHNCSLNTTDSARNLGFIFDSYLTFSDQISSLSKSCYYHIRALRCIRSYLDFKTVKTGLPSRTILDRIYSAQRFSIFSLIFSFNFGSCGRLSWLNCQLSSAR